MGRTRWNNPDLEEIFENLEDQGGIKREKQGVLIPEESRDPSDTEEIIIGPGVIVDIAEGVLRRDINPRTTAQDEMYGGYHIELETLNELYRGEFGVHVPSYFQDLEAGFGDRADVSDIERYELLTDFLSSEFNVADWDERDVDRSRNLSANLSKILEYACDEDAVLLTHKYPLLTAESNTTTPFKFLRDLQYENLDYDSFSRMKLDSLGVKTIRERLEVEAKTN